MTSDDVPAPETPGAGSKRNVETKDGRPRGDLYRFARHLIIYSYNLIVARIPVGPLRMFLYRRLFPVGKDSILFWDIWIRGNRIKIGENCVINSHVMLDGRGDLLTIGDNVDVAPFVKIWTREHDPYSSTHAGSGGPVTIGDHVWLASGATILPGVVVGEGAVVATNALVTKDVPPWTMVGGNPAKVIGERPRKIEYRLKHRPWFD